MRTPRRQVFGVSPLSRGLPFGSEPQGRRQATDVDDDGNTWPFDLAFLLGNWGPVGPNTFCLDADDDGEIGPFDLAFLLGNWGPCPPP